MSTCYQSGNEAGPHLDSAHLDAFTTVLPRLGAFLGGTANGSCSEKSYV